MVKIQAINWEFYKTQLNFREGLRGIVIPHNELFFESDPNFFESPEERVECQNGLKLYDLRMRSGRVIENVGWESPHHMAIYWQNHEVTNVQPLVKMIEDLSQTPTRALHWSVEGNRPPVWDGKSYVM